MFSPWYPVNILFNLKKNMRKIRLFISLVCLILASGAVKSQCIQSTQYPSGTISINATAGATTNVTGCNFGGEYSVNSFTATGVYSITSSFATDFITVTDANNNVLIFGNVPLAINIPSVGVYNIHISTDAMCGTDNSCHSIDVVRPMVGCSAVPPATVSASSASVCGSLPVNFNLNATYQGSGITYQWYASTAGSSGPYTLISGATLATYSSSFATSTWIQAVITCSNGPLTTTATPVQVIVGAGNACACTSYCSSSATSIADDEIFNVTIGTLNNTSACGVTAPGPGSSAGMYSNFAGNVAAPNLSAGIAYNMSVTVGQCNSGAYSGVVTTYIDFNQNGSFADPGELVYTSPNTLFQVAGTTLTTNISIPVGASTGITRMRVIAVESSIGQADCGTYTWGETEDYCVNITAPSGCSGAPAANAAVASQTNVCPSAGVSLGLANSYTVGGIAYQWSTAPNSSGPYTAVPNATLNTLTVSSLTASTWFQAVITCTNGNVSTTATPVQVTTNNNPCACTAYCASSATSTFDDEIFNVSLGTLNNTSSCSQTGGPGSTLNLYSNYTGLVAAPTLTVSNSYTLSVTAGQCNTGAYSGIVQAFIDYNQNGSFTDAGELVYTSPYSTFSVTGTTFTANITIPNTALAGITRMRVLAAETSVAPGSCGAFTWGETEDYCVNINPGAPCSAANGGSVTPASFMACANQTLALTSNSVSMGSGMVYQWMVSTTQGGPYTAVSSGSGSNTPSYITGSLTPNTFYYVLQATCTTASLTGSSNEVTVTVNPNPTATAASNAPICAGQNINFTGTSNIGTNFMWTGPSSFTSSVQNPTITNAPASAQGNYTLLVSTANCSATPVVVFVPVNSTNLTVMASPPSLCTGNSTTLTAVGNANTLTWSTGATSSVIVVSPSTNTVYSATGTGTSGCVATSSIAITVTNPTITGTGASICGGGSTATLSANAFGPVSWYATSTPTNALATGNTFTSNAVTTTTYYAQAVNTVTNTLFTTLAAGNGFAGNMFDVTALNNIEVNGFDMHFLSAAVATVEVWYRPGSFVGFESSNAGWTMAYTTTVNTLPTGTLTQVPGSFSVNVPSGQTYGFYVTANTGPQVNYTTGTALGAVYSANADAQIKQGKGGGYFSVLNSPRIFNGRMRYTAIGCTSSMIPVVLTVTSSANVTASAFSGTLCQGASTALNASGANTYTWSTGANGNVIAVTPSVTTTYSVNGDNGAGCVGTGTVQVTVNALPSVTLTAASTTACTNGPTIALTGSPSGGVYTGSNVSGNAFTPGGTAGNYIASYNVTSSVTGCSKTETVGISVSICTDINSKSISMKGLAVYPNPNLGEFTVELANGLNKNIVLTDLTGRVILTESTDKDKLHVNIRHLANGVYFVKVQSNNAVEIIKLVKQ